MVEAKRHQVLLPILLIMSALLVWGAVHAVGAFLFNYDARKPLIVFGCVLAFVVFWAVMLVQRDRRRSTKANHSEPDER